MSLNKYIISKALVSAGASFHSGPIELEDAKHGWVFMAHTDPRIVGVNVSGSTLNTILDVEHTGVVTLPEGKVLENMKCRRKVILDSEILVSVPSEFAERIIEVAPSAYVESMYGEYAVMVVSFDACDLSKFKSPIPDEFTGDLIARFMINKAALSILNAKKPPFTKEPTGYEDIGISSDYVNPVRQEGKNHLPVVQLKVAKLSNLPSAKAFLSDFYDGRLKSTLGISVMRMGYDLIAQHMDDEREMLYTDIKRLSSELHEQQNIINAVMHEFIDSPSTTTTSFEVIFGGYYKTTATLINQINGGQE
jgi:hypothetical protein